MEGWQSLDCGEPGHCRVVWYDGTWQTRSFEDLAAASQFWNTLSSWSTYVLFSREPGGKWAVVKDYGWNRAKVDSIIKYHNALVAQEEATAALAAADRLGAPAGPPSVPACTNIPHASIKLVVYLVAGLLFLLTLFLLAKRLMPMPPPPKGIQACSGPTSCPPEWAKGGGGYHCQGRPCRAGATGPFPDCPRQCYVGKPWGPQKLNARGNYDLRIIKEKGVLGCAAPVGRFPGQPKYGCSAGFSKAAACDAAVNPVKDTRYVAAVHAGCDSAHGRGTYGYAFDDGVGLKQCSPLTKYEWVLCPDGSEAGIAWQAESDAGKDAARRFRVTNKCPKPIWIQQAGTAQEVLPGEPSIRRIDASGSYTYLIPNRGLPSTRFLPKTGCDEHGNNCDIQSMPPCPADGCDAPIDTKFESSWGCRYATGKPLDKQSCTVTGQGNPSTYQDWWDGSAVDGWTLPFSILVDDGGNGLTPDKVGAGSPPICGPVVCANLNVETLCPRDEFLNPLAV